MIVGDQNYVARVISNTAVKLTPQQNPGSSNWKLNDVSFAGNHGYAVGRQGGVARFKTSTNGGQTWTIDSTSLIGTLPQGSEWNTVHVFRNGSALFAGKKSMIAYYNHISKSLNISGFAPPASIGGNVELHDIFFHDDVSGYVCGEKGVVLKTDRTASLNSSGFLNPLAWVRMRTDDDLNSQTDSTKMNIKAIAFAERYWGFMGGDYNGPVKNYARLVHDEALLWSVFHWYDKLGRLILTQDCRQFNRKAYSYTLYDALGRIKESGEKTENTTATKFPTLFGSVVNNFFNPRTIDETKYLAWVNDNTGARKEVTSTFYDVPVPAIAPSLPANLVQENLRKRIATVTFEEVFDNNDATYAHATHYSYDIHGNVKTLLQDNPSLAIINNQ